MEGTGVGAGREPHEEAIVGPEREMKVVIKVSVQVGKAFKK